MATVNLTIPDVQLTRVVNALCAAEGLPPTTANAKQALIRIIRRTVESAETVAVEPQVPNTDGIVS